MNMKMRIKLQVNTNMKARIETVIHMTTMIKTDDGQNENPSGNRTSGSP